MKGKKKKKKNLKGSMSYSVKRLLLDNYSYDHFFNLSQDPT